MKINTAIHTKITHLPICAEGKAGVTNLVTEIIAHLPEPPEPPKPKYSFVVGNVFSYIPFLNLSVRIFAVFDNYSNVRLESVEPINGAWNIRGINSGTEGTTSEDIRLEFTNLDEYLRKYPKDTEYLKQLFKLQDEHDNYVKR